MTARPHRLALGLLAVLGGCRGSLSPLSNKVAAGQEPFVVFVAEGEAGLGDLWASKPAGGTPFQVTFTRVDERLPALSPDGTMLAFLRSRAPGDTTPAALVVMNLLNGAERKVELAGTIVDALAWSRDGRTVYARRGEAILAWPAPPAGGGLLPVPPGDAPMADSAFRVLLGDPPLGEAAACPDGRGLCAMVGDGAPVLLTVQGSAPTRWPGDSVAYLEDGDWTVRPLAGGTARVLTWTRPPTNPRQLTAAGRPAP